MLSIIIIGKNEAHNIVRCFSSIYKVLAKMPDLKYELIFVDSNSSDSTISTVAQFPEVSIFKIEGPSNCAMGRNVGAKHAAGNVLYFVDSDMEIDPHFLLKTWNPISQSIMTDAISGVCIDVVNGRNTKRRSSQKFPGGTFLIKREIWEDLKGMRTKFCNGEDFDFGLRFLRRGYCFVRTRDVITKHYTTPYHHKSRLWKSLRNRNIFYSRCVLFRDHLFDMNMYSLLWRNDKTYLFLIFALILSISTPWDLIFLGGYFLFILARVLKNTLYVPVLNMMIYYVVSDVLNLIYLFSFFPKELREEYHVYQNPIDQVSSIES